MSDQTKDNQNPNPNDQNLQGGSAPDQQQQQAAGTQAQPSVYDDLAGKKGYKSPDDLAKSYMDLEQDRSKRVSAFDTAKQQL